MDEMIKKFEFLFPKDDLKRFSIVNGELYVDVHGMTCLEAQKFLKNVIALMKGDFCMYVIHGYNRGCAIKEMLQNTKLSTRNYQIWHISWNPGMTKLEYVAA